MARGTEAGWAARALEAAGLPIAVRLSAALDKWRRVRNEVAPRVGNPRRGRAANHGQREETGPSCIAKSTHKECHGHPKDQSRVHGISANRGSVKDLARGERTVAAADCAGKTWSLAAGSTQGRLPGPSCYSAQVLTGLCACVSGTSGDSNWMAKPCPIASNTRNPAD